MRARVCVCLYIVQYYCTRVSSTCACVRESDVRVRIRTCAGWPPTVASDGGMTTGGWMGGWVGGMGRGG